MATKPDKPGYYYAVADGDDEIVRVSKDGMVWFTGIEIESHVDAPGLHWHGEPVPTVAQVREMRAQVEFLEWTASRFSDGKLFYYQTEVGNVSYVNDARGKMITTWPGQLRDGWRHWDAIKEAVK